MKKSIIYVTVGSVALIMLVLSTVTLMNGSFGSIMILESKSPYSYEQTIAAIQDNAKEQNWIIPKKYDFQKSMRKHNQPDCGKVSVFKLCHPEIAGKMLASDQNKFVSVMMPCSVSVYEKGDGNTYVAAMNMEMMSKVMGNEMRPILQRVAREHEAILGFLE